MKLQLALDTMSVDDGIELMNKMEDHVDIIEVGTPMIMEYGMSAVRAFKSAFPGKTILADAKIMDGGRFEADSCFRAGADIVTVLAVANDLTIKAALQSSHEHGGLLMVDMIEAPFFAKRVRDLDDLGVDIICVHTAFDVKTTGKDSFAELRQTNEIVQNAKVALAGGITLDNLQSVIDIGADTVVVGTAIITSDDPLAVAAAMKRRISAR